MNLTKDQLNTYAKKLNKKIPKSEKWFKKLWKESGMIHKCDKFNKPVFPFIADVRNRKFKYIIEIDGSYHDREDQKKRDIVKDQYFKKRGYSVIRVKAFDENSFLQAKEKILELRLLRSHDWNEPF